MAFNYKLFFKHVYHSFFKTKNTHVRLTARRIKFLIIFYFTFIIYVSFTWFCFLLDELFFPGYKKTDIKKGIYIMGNFRSGSTFLQRLMARDTRNFTCFKTWEIYAAPSVSQRKLIMGIKLVDRFFGRPLYRLLNLFEKSMLQPIKMHKVGLREPEEDEALLLFIWSSFWIHFFFPVNLKNFPYPYFDDVISNREKKAIINFYRGCVQRHLFFHGRKKYFLSKNPCFTPKIASLDKYLENSRFVYLVRDPVKMLPSVTCWFTFWWESFANPLETYPEKHFIVNLCKHWYHYPLRCFNRMPEEKYIIIGYEELISEPEQTVKRIYDHFKIPLNKDFLKKLKGTLRRSKNYQKNNTKSLQNVGYKKEKIEEEFKEIFELYHIKRELAVKQRSKK
jgi:hypothetical protein